MPGILQPLNYLDLESQVAEERVRPTRIEQIHLPTMIEVKSSAIILGLTVMYNSIQDQFILFLGL